MPYWLWPCDHRGRVALMTRGQRLRHWAVDCKDEALLATRWHRPVGAATMVLGVLYIMWGTAVLTR